METGAILNRKRIAHLAAGFLVGAVVGAAISIAVLHLTHRYGGRESEISFLLMRPFSVTVWSASNLCELTGNDWPLGGRILSRKSLGLILTTNSLACGWLGICVEWAILFWKSRSKSKPQGVLTEL